MSDFIKVEKDGEVIAVHPDALKDHQQLGWKILVELSLDEAEAKIEELPAETPV